MESQTIMFFCYTYVQVTNTVCRMFRSNKVLIKELSTPPPNSRDLHFSTQYSQSFFNQCIACLWKQHWSYWRNPSYSAVRLLYTAMMALVFGTIFWGLGSKRYTDSVNYFRDISIYVRYVTKYET